MEYVKSVDPNWVVEKKKPERAPKKKKRSENSYIKALKQIGYIKKGELKPMPKRGSTAHQQALSIMKK